MTHRDPIRMCVACRQKAAQGDLLRLGVGSAGRVAVGQRPRTGRGAYVCARWRCLNRALQKGGVHRALRSGAAMPAPQEIVRQARVALSRRLHRLEASGGAEHERERATALLGRLDDLTAERDGERHTVDGAGRVDRVAHRDQKAGPLGGLGKAHG